MTKDKGLSLLHKLYETTNLEHKEWLYILTHYTDELAKEACDLALQVKERYFGERVYLRGLIEFTNYCHRHCLYCGLRCENKALSRYRLSETDILVCCKEGYNLGYRTFVLQGGEDVAFTDDKIESLVRAIHEHYPDCAITLSIGERSHDAYLRFFKAGATRYLLRHEAASCDLYEKLHPHMSFQHRIRCLEDLKSIGYQVGAGFMVGVPGQTLEDLALDLVFLNRLQPHMVGIGPFMPQHDTPLGTFPSGTINLTTFLLALVRLMLPDVLLPATTALSTLDTTGRAKGLQAGANVVMPNLSPLGVREKYALYDGKACLGAESATASCALTNAIHQAGFVADFSIGHSPRYKV
ncbi:MAG: [FeFe] hydrogenase H-cluster radical SAM maturase HydE [Niameybacter sp.]|uniref:[FeFe] hydrogenase H-cluster radical SAM maturase HydE n=1 Tax=Niameybacter sp. TaxID=2033640 RepID=UPI002FC87564